MEFSGIALPSYCNPCIACVGWRTVRLSATGPTTVMRVLADIQDGAILSANLIGAQAVLIRLSDGTGVLLTLDQLISLGVPRFLMPDESTGTAVGERRQSSRSG